jgi:pre-mRNA-processing factor SLU7
VYHGNHKAVWGSFWEDGHWGYACCGQLVKNSFCTGTAGLEARKRTLIRPAAGSAPDA